MGDRICLKFVDEDGISSPILYAHWAGKSLIDKANTFYALYKGKTRAESSNWMVNFISWLRKGEVKDGGYYLYPNEDICDSPDDNGFYKMYLATGKVRKYSP